MAAQQIDRGQRFHRRHVAGAGHHHVGLAARSLLAHSQMPMPAVQCFTASSMLEPLRRRLLARDDHVDAVPAAQAVIGDEQQRLASGGR